MMAQGRADMTNQPPSDGGKRPDRSRWDKILMPLTVTVFLVIFIGAMLIIYNIAQ